MKILLSFALLLGFNAHGKGIYSQSVKMITGKQQELSKFKGKPMLIVNIATRCGYTPQLEGLEAIHKKYKDKGLVVIGVPSNDFGGQTPEAEKEVKKFCKINYGVTFPLTKKAVVKGKKKHPLFATLVSSTNKNEVKWNFEKFLVDKEGKVIKRFDSAVKPESQDLKKAIEAVL